eukprot:gene20706-31908_t
MTEPKARPKGMWELQSSLRRLPLPRVEDSVQAYLEVLQALVPAAAYEEAKARAADFVAIEAAPLQKHLEDRRRRSEHASPDGADYPDTTWLERYWEEGAYLRGRDPVAVYLNVMLNCFDDVGTMFKLRRLAWFIRGIVHFKELADSGELEPETYFEKNEATGKRESKPFCSVQYRKLIGMTRLPGKTVDRFSCSGGSSTHAAVECKGWWFKVEVVGTTAATLEEQLRCVEERADSLPPPPGGRAALSTLTALNRTAWAAARDRILSGADSKGVADAVNMIETSLFCVQLGEHRPATRADAWHAVSHSWGRSSIWYDKGFTIVVSADGKLGCNVEHSPVDARPMLRMNTHASEFCTKGASAVVGCQRIRQVQAEPIPADRLSAEKRWAENVAEPVLFRYAAPGWLLQAQEGAAAEFEKLWKKSALATLTYEKYGAKQVKGAGVAPDSFAQMVLQVAYYRDQARRVPATYETASLRKFLHGRTETLRVTSKELVEFLEAFDRAAVPAVRKAALFRKACGVHRSRMTKCMNGSGFDRHLLGLRMAAAELGLPTPKLFAHTTYGFATTFRLSTSNLPGGGMEAVGFAAPAPDAYGVTYHFFDDCICFNMSATA